MFDLSTFRTFFRYSDWANDQLLQAAAFLPQEHLDREFDIGRGSLRRTLLHILAGEDVWLKRWKDQCETPWPDETERTAPVVIQDRFAEVYRERDRFLDGLQARHFGRPIVYRDSKGSLFSAPLADMIVQGILHSAHHRSQAVNILRRLGYDSPELDYMMWVRRPA
jgi:uncharacterized damage-inducible protein DinB